MTRIRSQFVFLALAAVLASATTVIPMSVEQLTRLSSHVVLARAVDFRSEWNASHTLIYTQTRFQVVRQVKGELPQTFIVRQMGGSAGGYTQKVSGVRHWQPGEEAFLFLHSGDNEAFTVTGLMQGDFRLRQERSGEILVSNGVPETHALSEDGKVTEYRGTRMTLPQLEQRVRRANAQ